MTSILQAGTHGLNGQFRGVAIAAQVAEQHMLQSIGGHLGHDLGSGRIGEMTMPGENPLLHRPGALGVLLEKGLIVVGLDQKGMHAADGFHDLPRGVPQIGQHRKARPTRPQDKADRIGGIMRNGEREDFQPAQSKPRSAGKKIPFCLNSSPLQVIRREWIRKDRHVVLGDKNLQPLGVIAVLMGEENSGKFFRFNPASLQADREPAGAQSRIDQHAALPGAHE